MTDLLQCRDYAGAATLSTVKTFAYQDSQFPGKLAIHCSMSATPSRWLVGLLQRDALPGLQCQAARGAVQIRRQAGCV